MSTSSDFCTRPCEHQIAPQSSSWSPHQLLPPPTDFYVLHSRPFHSHPSFKWILAGEHFLLFLHSTHNLTLYLAQSSCRFDFSQQSSTTHPKIPNMKHDEMTFRFYYLKNSQLLAPNCSASTSHSIWVRNSSFLSFLFMLPPLSFSFVDKWTSSSGGEERR